MINIKEMINRCRGFINFEKLPLLLLVIHPVFFLIMLYRSVDKLNAVVFFGNVLFGIMLGLVLAILCLKQRVNFKTKKGIIFLVSPVIMFLLTCLSEIEWLIIPPNSVIFWIAYAAAYLILGTMLFIEGGRRCEESERLSENNNRNEYIFASFAAFAFVIMFFSQPVGFSPDTFSFYDMSKNIFKDFGYVSNVRQYVEFTHYGISFPYLYPALIRIVDTLTGMSVFSGVIVNVLAAFATLYFMVKISKKLCGTTIPGSIAALWLFTNVQYIEEVCRARAVPLSILCAVLVINILAKNGEYTKKEIFLAGLFAGAGIVVRFDFMALAVLLGIVLIIQFKRKCIKIVPFYALGVLVFTSPWIIYSLARFGTLWISDNAGTAFMVNVLIPQRFYMPEEFVATAFNSTGEWLSRLQNDFKVITGGMLYELFRPQTLLLIAAAAALPMVSGGRRREGISQGRGKHAKWMLIACMVVYAIKTLGIISVGYADQRYHVESFAVIILLMLCSACVSYFGIKFWKRAAAVFVVLFVVLQLSGILQNNIQPKLYEPILSKANITASASDIDMAKVMMEHKGTEKPEDVSIFFVDGDGTIFSAYTSVSSYSMMVNTTHEKLYYLIEEYIKPDYIWVIDPELKTALEQKYTLTLISHNYPIYSFQKRI